MLAADAAGPALPLNRSASHLPFVGPATPSHALILLKKSKAGSASLPPQELCRHTQPRHAATHYYNVIGGGYILSFVILYWGKSSSTVCIHADTFAV